MPRETVALVFFMGLGFGVIWGVLSLVLWTLNERVAGAIIAPLWLTAAIVSQIGGSPYVVAAAVSTGLGLSTAALVLAFARARGA